MAVVNLQTANLMEVTVTPEVSINLDYVTFIDNVSTEIQARIKTGNLSLPEDEEYKLKDAELFQIIENCLYDLHPELKEAEITLTGVQYVTLYGECQKAISELKNSYGLVQDSPSIRG